MQSDPRDQITQTAFQIAPDLLGVELASPWRRAAAIGLDLVLAAIVSETGGGAAVGVVSAVLFVLLAMRTPSKSRPRRVGRIALVSLGALIMFGVGTQLVFDSRNHDDAEVAVMTEAEDVARMDELEEANRQLDSDAVDTGLDMQDLLRSDPRSEADSVWTDAERDAAARALRSFANAVTARDTLATDSLRADVVRWVAGADLDEREARIEELLDQRRSLSDERERLETEIENPSFLRPLLTLAADFGLTLGWIGIYFTLTLAWWGGYTPGKRLVGIRVVRLDGKPLRLWDAFERFGGYAAGLVTGLLGFAQVFWDANRQGVQDKVAGTVVVRMSNSTTPRQRGHLDVD